VSQNIGIAGAGRIGQALGKLLHAAAVAGRDPQRAARAADFVGGGARPVAYAELPGLASRIIIAVPDDAIEGVAAILADAGMRDGIALHTCGSRGADALAPLAARGVSCGALHPLQTVASPEQGVRALPGSAFGIMASGAAADWAREIVAILGGEALPIAPEHRALYHAAAVMASNYTVALIDAAGILMGEAGIQEKDALRALGPLVRASVENALTAGPVQALTGPIERGDTGTVAAHWKAMADAPESVRELYRAAGLHAIQVALRKTPGVDRRKMELLLHEESE
jgi:predicted short-subunit dehydrogenase-like oxidoreductase (DUF2520 family)